MSLDRFSEGIKDIQDSDYGYCINCGEGISEYSQSVTGCCEECMDDDDMRDKTEDEQNESEDDNK